MFETDSKKNKRYLEEKTKEINHYVDSKLESDGYVPLVDVLSILGFDVSGTNQGWIKNGDEVIFED